MIVATPGRLLDHFKHDYARLDALEILVLDEADRMLDMGFLPDIKKVLKHLPAKRQTMLFSATMPAPIMELARELQRHAATINLERKSAPAVGITQAVYPVREALKATLFLDLIRRGDLKDVIVFTRTKHRANRLSEVLEKGGVSVARIHGNRSQAQRTLALDGFKTGKFQVLVATDIVARGIDVEELSHVVNFDVPNVPHDYIHRVGRTARADATGDAFTFVSPEEEVDLRAIERAVGRTLPRVTVPGFNYDKAPTERFEVPIGERIAAIRARRAEERKRAKEKAERRTVREESQGQATKARSSKPRDHARREATPRHEAPRHPSRPAAAPTTTGRERVRGAWAPPRSAEPNAKPRGHDRVARLWRRIQLGQRVVRPRAPAGHRQHQSTSTHGSTGQGGPRRRRVAGGGAHGRAADRRPNAAPGRATPAAGLPRRHSYAAPRRRFERPRRRSLRCRSSPRSCRPASSRPSCLRETAPA